VEIHSWGNELGSVNVDGDGKDLGKRLGSVCLREGRKEKRIDAIGPQKRGVRMTLGRSSA